MLTPDDLHGGKYTDRRYARPNSTPPFGLLLFIMMGMVRGTTLGQVAGAAAPFLLCDFILVIILVLAPGIALYLPSLMGS